MRIYAAKDYKDMSRKAANLISAQVIMKPDAVLVLGAKVKADGEMSPMLKERVDYGIEIYRRGLAKKIIMSGDHSREDYDEVNTMKNYAVEQGVPSEDIFMDHAGFSTYESMYRAKEIFQTERVIVVTQKYHLYRAVYDARAFSMEAAGVACDRQSTPGTDTGSCGKCLPE